MTFDKFKPKAQWTLLNEQNQILLYQPIGKQNYMWLLKIIVRTKFNKTKGEKFCITDRNLTTQQENIQQVQSERTISPVKWTMLS